MRRGLWLVAAGIALAAPARGDPLEDLERAQQQLFERAARSVVYVAAGGHFGSGFALGPNGLVLTNEHVVHGSTVVDVVLHDGTRLKAPVVEVARDSVDLALLQLPGNFPPGLEFDDTKDLRVGSWAAAIGHGLGGVWTYTTGMISNIYPAGRDRPVFQTQIPVNPGNSGGPVLDRHGRVIGVTTAAIEGASNVAFGIRIDLALRVLDTMAQVCERCLVVRAPKNVPILVDGQMLGQGPQLAFFADKKTYNIMAVVGGRMRQQQVAFPAVKLVDLTK